MAKEFTVIVDTAQISAEAQSQIYNGSHPIQSKVPVMGKEGGVPAFIQIRNILPAETLTLIKQY